MAKKRKLRVGFDFDGVVVYNPLRIFRPFVAVAKKIILRPKKLKFYYPQTSWEKFFWFVLHQSSIFPAPGFPLLKKLLKEGKIEGYLLTSRYSCLGGSFYHWLKKHQVDQLFKGCYLNKKNEQPHKFKERMIKKLKLDLYLDDNWDIVNYLHATCNMQHATCEIHWVYNVFDRRIDYPRKHPHLASFLKKLVKRFKIKV